MSPKTWKIGALTRGVGAPTHIIVNLHDPKLLPAVKEFVSSEGLHLQHVVEGGQNEYVIAYPHADLEKAQARLEDYIINLYWDLQEGY